jgi:hypothetical protein
MTRRHSYYPDQEARAFRRLVSSYESTDPFFDAIYDAVVRKLSRVKREALLLDAMSGPGRLGCDILDRYSAELPPSERTRVSLTFNDVRPEALVEPDRRGFGTICSDIRNLNLTAERFDVVAVRYGLKDLPLGEAVHALRAIHGSLNARGRVVVADAYAHGNAGQEALNELHAAKQHEAGRDPRTEGRCFIPTLEEWLDSLHEAGFHAPWISFVGRSEVSVGDWAGQFGSETDDTNRLTRLRRLVARLVSENPAFADSVNAQLRDNDWRLSFPIAGLVADK